MTDQEQRLAKLQKQFHGLRIMGGEGVTVQGSPTRGYTVEVRAGPVDSSNVGGGGPGPTPTGACCIDTACHILTSDDCVTMGGAYIGDSMVCDPNPCICPDISLVCDSISASLTKCGFSALHIVECGPPFADLGYSNELNYTGCSAEFGECASSGGSTVASSTLYLTRNVTLSGIANVGGCDNGCDTCGTQTLTSSYNADCSSIVNSGSGADLVCCVNGLPAMGSHSVTGSIVLSDEYTTVLLISNTEAVLPAYPGNFTGSCAASLEVSMDETSCSIQRFKPKFTFTTSAINFTLTYNEHFVPDVGSPSDTMRTLSVNISDTEALGSEVLEPTTNGTITITDILCTPV